MPCIIIAHSSGQSRIVHECLVLEPCFSQFLWSTGDSIIQFQSIFNRITQVIVQLFPLLLKLHTDGVFIIWMSQRIISFRAVCIHAWLLVLELDKKVPRSTSQHNKNPVLNLCVKRSLCFLRKPQLKGRISISNCFMNASPSQLTGNAKQISLPA